jgi:bacterioferritin-associated ferredoxin
MIVCSCNVIRCRDVKALVAPDGSGPRTPAQVYGCLGTQACCGRCAPTIRDMLREARAACASQCATCARQHIDCAVAVQHACPGHQLPAAANLDRAA